MLKAGNAVKHPQFPEWGRGIILKVFFDNVTGKAIAKVMWQNLYSQHLPLHTLASLVPFAEWEEPEKKEPIQLTLSLG
jgi:hypothetical protein